jgi:hypothetical protein
MKKQSRKLNLNRETLIPLQSSDIAAINGGATPAIVSAASAVSAAVTTLVQSRDLFGWKCN